MAYIPAAESQRRLVERLIKVLRAKLATEAAALNAGEGATGNPIPVPPHPAYFRLGTEADIESILPTSTACVMIVPTGAADVTEDRTGTPTEHARLDTSTWRVVLLFRVTSAWEPIVTDGVKLLQSEVVWRMADRMRAALMLTLTKYAANGDDIHDLRVVNHYADYTALKNGQLTGRAVLEVEIKQDVLLPQPVWGGVP